MGEGRRGKSGRGGGGSDGTAGECLRAVPDKRVLRLLSDSSRRSVARLGEKRASAQTRAPSTLTYA